MRGSLLLLFATLLWGFWGVADKLAVTRAHPLTVQWMYAVPYIVTLPIFFWLGRRAAPETNLDGTAFVWAALASVASIAALLLMLYALEFTPASVAVAITAAYPLVTLLLSVATGAEAFNPRTLLGILVIIGGVIILQGGSQS